MIFRIGFLLVLSTKTTELVPGDRIADRLWMVLRMLIILWISGFAIADLGYR